MDLTSVLEVIRQVISSDVMTAENKYERIKIAMDMYRVDEIKRAANLSDKSGFAGKPIC